MNQRPFSSFSPARMDRRLTPVPTVLYALLVTLGCSSGPTQRAGAEQGPESGGTITLDQLFDGHFRAEDFGPAWWLEDSGLATLERAGDGKGQDLVRYDPASGQREIIVAARQLVPAGGSEPLEISDYQFSGDGERVLIFTNTRRVWRYHTRGDYWLLDRSSGELRQLGKGFDEARLQFAKFDPAGRRVAYLYRHDIYVENLADRAITRLTHDGSDTLTNGTFDWVYEEEFGLTQAWDWSPDGRRIAYWQTHVADVPTIQITDWEGQYPEWTVMPFPKVGQDNSEVLVGVVDVASGETRWMDVGLAEEHYVPRIYWTSDPNTLAVVTLNRHQNHLQVFFFDVRSGERRLVMEERSEAWIDVFDFFASATHFFNFPEGSRDFLWISDRDGSNHLYRYSYDGELLDQVTAGEWVVTRVEGIDAATRTIYYTGTEESPLQRHLYAIDFDGGNKRRLTGVAGNHAIDMSPSTDYYIDT